MVYMGGFPFIVQLACLKAFFSTPNPNLEGMFTLRENKSLTHRNRWLVCSVW
ncbi:hypothetical protein [Photobacterium nomapromontoriensis]|uniref:hypothetical protein n=1 Tax=Photobacterium nomapromontoriensis TaxID=2910237 RepID=UPI003D0A99A3